MGSAGGGHGVWGEESAFTTVVVRNGGELYGACRREACQTDSMGGAQPAERVSWRLRTANGRPRIVALENRVIWSGHVANVAACPSAKPVEITDAKSPLNPPVFANSCNTSVCLRGAIPLFTGTFRPRLAAFGDRRLHGRLDGQSPAVGLQKRHQPRTFPSPCRHRSVSSLGDRVRRVVRAPGVN